MQVIEKINDNSEITPQEVLLADNKNWNIQISDGIDNEDEKNETNDDNIIEDMSENTETKNKIDNFPSEPRSYPIIHSAVEKPVCKENLHDSNCMEFKGLDCEACFELISDPSTTVPQLFAYMRDWCPGSQRHMDILVDEMFKRGAHIDDVDSLEGNTILHYACKSASEGLGFVDKAQELVKLLLQKGANYKLRSRWTDMLALHYAAYFDCPEILELLLHASENRGNCITMHAQFNFCFFILKSNFRSCCIT